MKTLNELMNNGTHKIETAGMPVSDSADQVSPGSESLTSIHLQDVTPQLMAPLREHEYTVSQNQDIVITANMAWPDGQFRIPMVRTDTQREVPVLGTVLNGVLTVTVNFPTAGYWECGNAQINSRLPEPLFDMPTIQFVVV